MNSPDAGNLAASGTPPTRRELEEDHRHVEALLDRVESTTVPWRLTPLLEDLHKVLTRHFRLEEAKGGLLDTVTDVAPRHASRVEALIADHGKILDALAALIRDTEAHPNGPPEAMLREAKRLIDRLRRHEEEENLILEDGYLTDLGHPGAA
jgi:hypothetical protein